METPKTEKQYIIETIDLLSDDLITELSNFVNYLHYKSQKEVSSDAKGSSFLLSIAALGASGETNVSQAR